MKCVENVGTGKIIRVSDDEALALVNGPGRWDYVPKSMWKLYRKISREELHNAHQD